MSRHQTPNVTPFIPPLHTPEALQPSVVPPSSAPPSPWTMLPQHASNYPVYPSSPYTSTPFIPSLTPAGTPGGPPAGYFPATGPPAAPPQLPSGLSADYTGYPTFASGTPSHPPSAGLYPSTPWQQSAAWPTSAPAHQTQSPWGPQPMAMGPPPPPQQQPPLTAGGYPGMGPTMGPAMGPAMGPPMARPQRGGWGAPPPGQHSFNTPGPSFPGPLAPDAWGMNSPGHWGMPPQPPQPQQQAPLGRATGHVGDRVDKFAVGNHYGPVLEPFLVKAVGADIMINPLLLPPPDDGNRPHLKWNMLFLSNNCQRSTDPSHVSWVKGREEPATFPRVTSLRLVSETFPWMIDITARNRDVGVTCGDVIESISHDLFKFSGQNEYNVLSAVKKRLVGDSYRHNRSRAYGAPGGSIGEGMRRLDWLCKESMFGGLVRNDQFVKKLCGDLLPCTVELKCIHRYPMTAEEIRDHDARGRTSSRTSRRRRSMVESTTDEGSDSD